jgi:hypothetical protein
MLIRLSATDAIEPYQFKAPLNTHLKHQKSGEYES